MAEPALNLNDPIAIFRAAAEGVSLPPAATKVLQRGMRAPNADNDDDGLDPELYETGPHRDKATRTRRQNSAQEQLARKSGQVITDELTSQGQERAHYGNSVTAARAATQRAENSGSFTGWITSSIPSVTGTLRGWADTAYDYGSKAVTAVKDGFNNYVYEPLATLGGNIKQGFNDWVAQPVANAYNSVTTWAGAKYTQAKETASGAWESTKSFFGYGSEPATQTQQTAQPVNAPKPSAAAQPLAGMKNNPTADFSLSGMYNGLTSALGLGADKKPALKMAAPSRDHHL